MRSYVEFELISFVIVSDISFFFFIEDWVDKGLIEIHNKEFLLWIFVIFWCTWRFWQFDAFFLDVLLGRSFQVVHWVEKSLIEKSHKLFVVIVRRVGSSQIDETVMFAERRLLRSMLFFFFFFMFDGFESLFAERFAVKCGQCVISENSSHLHISSKNRNYIISF